MVFGVGYMCGVGGAVAVDDDQSMLKMAVETEVVDATEDGVGGANTEGSCSRAEQSVGYGAIGVVNDSQRFARGGRLNIERHGDGACGVYHHVAAVHIFRKLADLVGVDGSR